MHKRGQSFTIVSRNLKPPRQEYYNHFSDVFAENILAEDCTYREKERNVDGDGMGLASFVIPLVISLLTLTLPFTTASTPPYILGVLDGEVVAIHKQSGEHEAFGHNKTVAMAISKAVRAAAG